MNTTGSLNPCLAKHNCPVCRVFQEDKDGLRQVRDLYIARMPLDLIGEILRPEAGLTGRMVSHHARRHGWQDGRSEAGHIEREFLKNFTIEQTIRRLVKAQDVISENTGDRMINNLMKITGLEQKAEINQNISFSWEKVVNQGNSPDDDATLTLSEEEFSELELPPPAQLEDLTEDAASEKEHAETD